MDCSECGTAHATREYFGDWYCSACYWTLIHGDSEESQEEYYKTQYYSND